ncbi:hypothetical protein Tco_0355435 [Tanacetum coccineum]
MWDRRENVIGSLVVKWLGKDPTDCQLSTPNSHHEIEEVSSDKDVDEWLNAEMGKRMIGQDKDEEEDALIDILKTLVEECKSIYKKAQIPSSRTSEIQGLSFVAEEEEGEIILRYMIWLMLTDLKKTSMVVEMADMTKKAPLGIVENIPIDVFRGEISLGIGNEKVKFDTNGEIYHSRGPHEKIYMASSIQKDEYFNPHEVENDDSPALEQRTLHYSEENIDTVDSSDDSQEDEVGNHLSEDVVLRWHVCKPVHVTFKVYKEDCGLWPTCNPDLSFCSGHDAIYGKEKNGMLKQWVCFQDPERQNVRGNGMKFADFLKVRYGNKNIDDATQWVKENCDFESDFERTRDNPYSRNFRVYTEEIDDEIKQLENEYELKAGRKKCALEEVWEKCEKFHDETKLWYDKGFEEEELWQNGIEEIDYTPTLVKSKTLEVHR